MRKYVVALVATVALLTLGAPAFAKTMTVSGKLVDEGCGLKDAAAKQTMKADCELECAKSGEPVALLTADGKVYRVSGGLAANKNAKLVAHMSHTVEITGDVVEQGGKMVLTADALKMVSK